MRILFILVITFQNAYALPTTFEWRLTRDGNLNSGNCFEVDIETQGTKYQDIVNDKKCRPENSIYSFNYLDGRCYEVDPETMGKTYFKKISIDLCRPKNTAFKITSINNKTRCFEVDLETGGKKFYKSEDKLKCAGDNYQLMWKQRTETKGDCFKTATVEGKIVKLKVKEKLCKPEKTEFRFVRLSPFRGKCVESHPQDPKLYFQQTKIENCKPENTLFIFYREDELAKGVCYEVDEETKGDLYLDEVQIENCKRL